MTAMARVLAGFVLALAVSAPAAAQGLFDALVKAAGNDLSAPSAQTEGTSPVKQFDAAQPAAAAKPTKAGPAGLVEAVSAASGIEVMDYVYAGQSIDLGAKGSITIAYFESCVVDTIKGGRVTITAARSEVSGGQVSSKPMTCQGAKPVIVADASEAGAGAKRVTPFAAAQWYEQVSKSRLPTFKWPSAGGPAQVTVSYLDARPERLVWQENAAKAFVSYPKTAPALEVGRPYRVEVRTPTRTMAAIFSVDPALDVSDNAVSRLVRVEAP